MSTGSWSKSISVAQSHHTFHFPKDFGIKHNYPILLVDWHCSACICTLLKETPAHPRLAAHFSYFFYKRV